MAALLKRNIKIYFANRPGVMMSCLGALISFFIYIEFLKQNLLNEYKVIPNAKEMLDFWMISGIITIAGITTSFQAMGQLVKDRETRTSDDLKLTNVSLARQIFAYILSSSAISLVMQALTFVIMAVYFKFVDQINLSKGIYIELLAFMTLGALGATLINAMIVSFVNSATTFSRISAIIGAAAGFAVATYIPYGELSSHAQNMIKLIPSSYEAASLRSLLLNQISKNELNETTRNNLINYLGIHFKINGYQLSRLDNFLIMLGMIIILMGIIAIISAVIDRKRKYM